MDEYEIILDFSDEEMDDTTRARLIKAVTEKKKIKTTMKYWGDGDYNSINTPEVNIVFNTNTLVGLGQDMGLEMDYSEPSEEDMEEILKDLNENGPDDSYNIYLNESKDDFLD